jgi:hypothetical protein
VGGGGALRDKSAGMTAALPPAPANRVPLPGLHLLTPGAGKKATRGWWKGQARPACLLPASPLAPGPGLQNAPAGCTETACLPLGFQGQTHRLKYTAGALARRTRSGAVGAPRYARLGSAGGAHGQCGGRARRDARWGGASMGTGLVIPKAFPPANGAANLVGAFFGVFVLYSNQNTPV